MRSISSSAVRMVMAAFAVAVVTALIVVWLNPSQADSSPRVDDSRHGHAGSGPGFGSGFAPGFAAGDSDLPKPTEAQRQALRDDLKAAWKLDGDARAKALKAVQAKAAAGAYGEAVKAGASRLGKLSGKHPGGFGRGPGRGHGFGGFDPAKAEGLTDAILAFLPVELQTDLKAAQAAPADQRKAKLDAVMTKALNGEYGAKVTELAKQLKAFGPAVLGTP